MRKSFNPLFWVVLCIGLYGFAQKEGERKSKIEDKKNLVNVEAKFIKVEDKNYLKEFEEWNEDGSGKRVRQLVTRNVWERFYQVAYRFEGQDYLVSVKDHLDDIDPVTRIVKLKINTKNPGTPVFEKKSFWEREDLSFHRYHSFTIIVFCLVLLMAHAKGYRITDDFKEQIRRERFAFVENFKKRNPALFQQIPKEKKDPKGMGYAGMFLIFYFVVNSAILMKSEWSRNQMIRRVVPVEATLVSRVLEPHHTDKNPKTETYAYTVGGKKWQFKEFQFDMDAVPGETRSYFVDPLHPQKLRKTPKGTFFGDHMAFFMINFSIMFFCFMFSIPAFVIYRGIKWIRSRMTSSDKDISEEKSDTDRMAS